MFDKVTFCIIPDLKIFDVDWVSVVDIPLGTRSVCDRSSITRRPRLFGEVLVGRRVIGNESVTSKLDSRVVSVGLGVRVVQKGRETWRHVRRLGQKKLCRGYVFER